MVVFQSYFLFKACDKCNGDLTTCEDGWFCLQCGKIFYDKAPQDKKPRKPRNKNK